MCSGFPGAKKVINSTYEWNYLQKIPEQGCSETLVKLRNELDTLRERKSLIVVTIQMKNTHLYNPSAES